MKIKLKTDSIKAIKNEIENTDIMDGSSYDNEIELEQDGLVLFITYDVMARLVEDYNIHNELSGYNIEDLSGYEYEYAAVTDITAFVEDGDEVEIENKKELLAQLIF